MAEAVAESDPNRWRFLGKACLAVVLSLTTWFSATAVIPELKALWQLGPTAAALLTNGVQAGFVVGALSSSVLGLPDRWPLNRMIAGSAALAAIANLTLLVAPDAAAAIAARVVTGIALAGVYPPAIKLMATWFRKERGLALGLLIGALTLGSALPHLVRGLGAGFNWRIVVTTSSVLALIAAGIAKSSLREGPFPFSRSVVDARLVGAILRNRPIMLANLGYFGHMWELYAMWGWFVTFATAAAAAGNPIFSGNVSALTFAVIAIGAFGAACGGLLAFQMGVGFAITIVAIWALPLFAQALGGWHWAFVMLVPGPAIGVISMAFLRANPAAVRLAGGRR
jgi:MFS family permease